MRRFWLVVAALSAGTHWVVADPLHDAAANGDVAAVTLLLDQGADAAKPDEAGEPTLIIASLAGKPDVVALLLERGTDIGIRNKGGLTALHAAAYGGNLETVKLLVAKGMAVNDSTNFYHMAPLHAAAEQGHAEVVAFLLANGAEVDAKERNGYTPLTQAGWRDYWDAGVLLLKAGAVCQGADLVGERMHAECMKRK